jgi:hypothetical protein
LVKLTKAQARKRLKEARAKLSMVMLDERFTTLSESKKLYDMCQYIGRLSEKLK